MLDFFWFSDNQWSLIEPLLLVNSKGARRVDDRRVLSGIVHALQSGGRWVDCPPVYVPKKTLYNGSCVGLSVGYRRHFQRACRGGRGPDRLLIDSTCIKAHRTAGGAKGRPWPMVSARHAAAEIPRSMPSAT